MDISELTRLDAILRILLVLVLGYFRDLIVVPQIVHTLPAMLSRPAENCTIFDSTIGPS